MGKILRNIIATVAVTSLAAAVHSCNTSGCTELRSATPRADFYSSLTDRALTVDSLRIYGIGAPGDSAMLVPGETATKVYLPMRSGAESVSWRIVYAWEAYAEDDIADTLTVNYQPIAWFAGEECGAMYKYRIRNIEYTHNLIDSIGVADSMVINVDRPTFDIFFMIE